MGEGMAEEGSARGCNRGALCGRRGTGVSVQEEAERFLAEFTERLRKFGLELNLNKTRLIEFGRYAAENRKKRGAGKPETFNFLGFTHICGNNHKTGYFMVLRETIGKRMTAKLNDIRRS